MFAKLNVFLLFFLIFIICISNNLLFCVQDESQYLNDKILNDIIITQTGIASHYGKKFNKRKTANGELLDLFAFSSAHKKLPFGTIVKVINKDNNLATLVRINDRGPFIKGRIIDLTHRPAKEINGMNNPNVDIQYFDNEKVLKYIDSNYLLGYSLYDSFIIINKNVVNIIDSVDNFEAAMNFYTNANDSTIYIFIKSNKQQQYFIGSKK